MMTVTVATVATERKVNLNAMMRKVAMSLTKKESLKKGPRNHVIIVKVGICPQLWWLNVADAFGTITILFLPFVVTTSQLTTNISKKPFPVVMTVLQPFVKARKHRKRAYIFRVKIKTAEFVILFLLDHDRIERTNSGRKTL